MKSQAVLFWLGLLFLFCGIATCWAAWGWLRATGPEDSISSHVVVDQDAKKPDLIPLERFTLTDQQGQEFCSDDLLGKVWICSFFYSSCPSICKMQNAMVAKLQQDYQDHDVHFVSITCDPNTDTPAVLAAYSQMFSANPERWHFLTGNFDYIQRIGPMMETVVKEETHSDRLFVVDRQGKKRGGFRSTQPEQFAELKNQVDQLLSQPVEQQTGSTAVEEEIEEEVEASGGETDGAVPGDEEEALADQV